MANFEKRWDSLGQSTYWTCNRCAAWWVRCCIAWGKLQLPNVQRWGIRWGQSAVWKIGYPKISRWWKGLSSHVPNFRSETGIDFSWRSAASHVTTQEFPGFKSTGVFTFASELHWDGEQWCWTLAETLGETHKSTNQEVSDTFFQLDPLILKETTSVAPLVPNLWRLDRKKRALFEIGVSESGDKTNKILNFMWFNAEWWSTFCFFF
jgi:hypothetical protein